MYKNEQTEKKRRRKYPGHRPCLNHDLLDDFFKNPVPELCPKCFAATAKHQVQLAALNHCAIEVLRLTFTAFQEQLDVILDRFDQLDNEVDKL